MKRTKFLLLGIFFCFLVTSPTVKAENIAVPVITTTITTVETTTDRKSLLELIEDLKAQVEFLQQQLADKRQRESFLVDGLKLGVTHNDVIKIQKLLASDPTIYPEGIITGYYGNMTHKAVINFQVRHNLAATGEIDTPTKTLLQNYLKKGFDLNS